MRKRRVNRIVLDASAVLAMILNEPGGERVNALLDALELGSDTEVFISSVNWCEILTRMQRDYPSMMAEELTAALANIELVPFDKAVAEVAAGYALFSQALSLGDRACLALAKSQQASAWTTERLWSQCQLDVPVELIRG
jgi:PIN domain nuclease of toxin-antitoxin system